MASVLYVANTTAQSVLANGAINLGSIIRRVGSQLNLTGNGISICGNGYYVVDVNVTFTVPAVGDATIMLYQDGTPVVGASGTESVTVASTSINSISFTAVVRNTCCNNYSTLTVMNNGVAIDVSNIAVRVKRDA